MSTLGRLTIVGIAAYLLLGVNAVPIAESGRAPIATPASASVGIDPAAGALHAALGPPYAPARRQSVWADRNHTRFAQQNQCACVTYSNSVCSGPCMPNGRPLGCLCQN